MGIQELKALSGKRSAKMEREWRVLLGLVDLYLETGKPVGSNTLKNNGFKSLSSATIRNYFSHLEEAGYLLQQHTSGGRIPTAAAYRAYAEEHLDNREILPESEEALGKVENLPKQEIAAFLHQASEELSQLTHTAVFLSAPRFDNDFVRDFRLVPIDVKRCLCVLMTDFGLLHTELLHSEELLAEERLHRIDAYFRWRFHGEKKAPPPMPENESQLAQKLYNEVMVRYIVGYSNFSEEDIYRTGLSRLLHYPEFSDVAQLAGGLSLFENLNGMRLLLRECMKVQTLKFWIGKDLSRHIASSDQCSVLACPYFIKQAVVGAVGILGPMRVPYRELFGILRHFSEMVSRNLTDITYKYQINFRQADMGQLYLTSHERSAILLEDKRPKKKEG